jgi:hypothetical protein
MTDSGGKSDSLPREPPTGDTAERGPGVLARIRTFFRTRTFGRWTSRLLSLLGIALIILGLTGWWLTTRVLDDDGFGDVVAKTVQQQAVRDYIGNQATLQLARSNKLITAARPVAAKAVAEAINTPAVLAAVHSFAAGAHHQIFQISNTSLSSAGATNAAASIKAALEAVDPKLADKLPDNVLNATANISQNRAVDAAARVSSWVPLLYIPVGILGVAILLLVLIKAKEPVQATRFMGFTMAIAGALPIGLGIATPLFRDLGANADPGRGAAVAAFIKVLLGRLVGAGWAMSIVGLLLAFAPGHDGATIGTRATRVRSWFRWARTRPWWQLSGALLAVAVAALLITRPNDLAYWVGLILAAIACYVAFVVILGMLGVIAPGQRNRPVRKRQIGAVVAAMVGCIVLTTAATATAVVITNQPGKANPRADGCNGSIEVCLEPLNQVVFAGSHNSMSSSAYNFFGAEHTVSIPEQLNLGARALLIDAYYGYKDNGIVRTNLAGGANRADIQREFGNDAVKELDRLGALTGTADTSGKKNDIYLCHDYCELGAIKASTVFSQINDFLNRNVTDVIILDVEDYVQPADLEKALKAGHLWDRVYTPDLTKPLPTMLDLVNPIGGKIERKQRVIVTSENHADAAPWLIGSYDLMQETPYTFTAINQFNCQPNRGASTNPMLLVNHWLRPNGPPDPGEASEVNSSATLTARMQQCENVRRKLPNILAVDFFAIGDTVKVVDNFNAAVASVTGTAGLVDRVIDAQRGDPNLSDQDRADLDQWKRLPFVSAADAQALLGPVAKKLAVPQRVKDLEHALATIGPSAVWTTPSTAPSTSSPSLSKAPTTPSNGHS